MGSCGGDDTKPYKFSLQDLQDMKVDDTKEMPQGCGPNIGGQGDGSGYDWLIHRGFGWPDNNEFEWGGLGGDCGLCSDVGSGYGCECSGDKAIGGKRGKVRRKAFKGDPTKCCFANFGGRGSASIVDGNTCDFDYRDPSSTACTNVYRDYCKSSNKIIDDYKCKSLSNSNSTLYNQLMKEYCNKNVSNSLKNQCLDWCKSNSTECTVLNLQTDCAKYGFCENNDSKKCGRDCTRQNVVDIQAKCKKYGIESEQGMRLYGCTKKGINLIEKECTEFGVDLSLCSPIALQDAKQNKLAQEQLRIQEEAKVQSQKNYEQTQNTIADVLGLPSVEQTSSQQLQLQQTENKLPGNDKQEFPYLIVIVIILLICCLSSSSLSSLGIVFL